MNISLPNITAPSAGEARKTGSLVRPATARDGPAIATGMPDFGLAYDKSAEPFPGSAPAQEPETGMTGTGQRPAKHAGGAEPEDLDASFMGGPHDDAEEISSPHLSEGASRPAATGAPMPKPQAERIPEIASDQMAVDDSTGDEVSAFHNRTSPEANPQLQRILAPRQDHSVLRQQPEESLPDIAHEGPDARAPATALVGETARQHAMGTNPPKSAALATGEGSVITPAERPRATWNGRAQADARGPSSKSGKESFDRHAIPDARPQPTRSDRQQVEANGLLPQSGKEKLNRHAITTELQNPAVGAGRETSLERAVTGQMIWRDAETGRSATLSSMSFQHPPARPQPAPGDRQIVTAKQQLDQPVIPVVRNAARTMTDDSGSPMKPQGDLPAATDMRLPQQRPSAGDVVSGAVQERETPRQPVPVRNIETGLHQATNGTEPVTATRQIIDRPLTHVSRPTDVSAPVAPPASGPAASSKLPDGLPATAGEIGLRRSDRVFDDKRETNPSRLLPQTVDRSSLNARVAVPVSGSARDAAVPGSDPEFLISVTHRAAPRALTPDRPTEQIHTGRDVALPQMPRAASPTRAAMAAPLAASGPEATKTDTTQPASEPNRPLVPEGHGGPRMDVMQTTSAPQTAAPHRADLPVQVARQLADALQNAGQGPVDIALNPEELGRLRLALSTTEAGMAVQITAERPDTIELMRRHITELAQEFRQLGYADISFTFAGGDTRQEDGAMARPSHATETQAEAGTESPAEIVLSATPESGIDIRL
ncbi:flagellar hook-length control protein FliK [Sulfitobacter sp. G21635-S1]|uniref:flagellar hook-length control protein FliK n=1 Tax=Sulfitobacter sp. G21635-S1 TaxID=3014043 RepID=UPI0022AF4371|nr:flagellar hook-length control protein FliK [Sulfitobacter sp. G21635-S1]MCZ4257968.1 flagellar hook-length control protein FliK [Sulfitobacter sp. G21635-S1]